MPTHLLRLRHVLRPLDNDFASVLLRLVGVSRDKEDETSFHELQNNCCRIFTEKSSSSVDPQDDEPHRDPSNDKRRFNHNNDPNSR